jgi:hypothetical protein
MEPASTTRPAAAWNEFDEFTLSVMSNRNHYDKYLKAKTNAQTLADIFRREQTYYKERIIDMTRDLFDSECDDNDVNESYHAYMKCCIRYLKWKDVTEMIQKEKYATEGGPELEETDAVSNARQELDKRIQEAPLPVAVAHTEPEPEPEPAAAAAAAPPRYIEDNKALISFANKMCIRKKTMDDFIVMKPAPVASSANLPQIRDYHDEIAKRSVTERMNERSH